MVFKNIEPMPGSIGPRGEIGPKGIDGKPGECLDCFGNTDTTGDRQNRKRKYGEGDEDGEIFIETPLLKSNLVGKPV